MLAASNSSCSTTDWAAYLDRQSSSVSRDQLESDHACQNENNAEHPQWRSGVAQHRHSQDCGARRADAGPDRVASPHRQGAERERKKKDARQTGGDRKQSQVSIA